MRMRIALLPLLLCLAFGCASRPAADPAAELLGTSWLAEDIDGRGVLDFAQTTLQLETGERVSGNGGCNRYFGEAELDGPALRFGPLGATRMACPQAVMDQEQRFFAALDATRAWRIDELTGLLFFIDADAKDVLRFSRLRQDRDANPAR